MGGSIGLSNHKNAYRNGVCVNNWAEVRLAADAACSPAAPAEPMVSVTRATFGPDGKFGAQIAVDRQDMEQKYACTGRQMMFNHQGPKEGVVSCFTTLNQLAFGEKHLGEPRVTHYIWSGRNKVDAKVPQQVDHLLLQTAKQRQWRDAAHADMYQTTSHTAAQAVADAARGIHTKRQICKPAADGGQASQIGRKAKGECAQLFDKTYIKIGLRQ
ncbi:hypothetical protein WJX72_008748 [[Myrmecia] bisecta]|uniref:Uncharacterized protein n=1 Tax=[Myrmecia] bisecta TaxID=41462 RepID=A0AAW1PAQ8_9CHLO